MLYSAVLFQLILTMVFSSNPGEQSLPCLNVSALSTGESKGQNAYQTRRRDIAAVDGSEEKVSRRFSALERSFEFKRPAVPQKEEQDSWFFLVTFVALVSASALIFHGAHSCCSMCPDDGKSEPKDQEKVNIYDSSDCPVPAVIEFSRNPKPKKPHVPRKKQSQEMLRIIDLRKQLFTIQEQGVALGLTPEKSAW